MIPVWAMSLPWPEIKDAAYKAELSPFLVAAIVMTESGGNTLVTRYEPAWRYFATPEIHASRLKISVDTERQAQAHSWGLMQVMGGTARGLGHMGLLTELLSPEIGLRMGCMQFSRMLKKYSDVTKALSAYNAGTPRDVAPADGVLDNQEYVDKAMAYLNALKGG